MAIPGSKFVRIALWLAAIGAASWWVWHALHDFSGSDLVAIPAAIAFALLVLAAGSPHLWHGSPRKVVRLRKWRFVRIERPGKRFSILRTIALTAAFGITIGVIAIPYVKAKIAEGLPKDLSPLTAYDPPVTTRVYSADHELVCTFTLEDRVRIPLADIPPHVRNAFIAAEDKSFYGHHGVDPLAIARAVSVNYRSGVTKQGASTLTQQAIKQVLLRNNERTYRRKLQEAILAIEIEKRMTKDQILEVYLNHVFLGHGAYGVQSAAQAYFGKDVSQLTLSEAALLAGLPRAPSRDSPYNHYDRSRVRQAYVFDQMVVNGFATQTQVDEAKREEIVMISHVDPINRTAAPYFCDHTRRELKRMFGNEEIFKEGLTVETSLDMKMQRAAESAVRSGLIDLERRIGWNGPEGHDATFKGCVGPAANVPDGTIELARLASITNGAYAVCAKGNTFPMHPDDIARMTSWNNRSKTPLAIGDTMSIRIATMPTVGAQPVKGVTPTTRYATAARRTAGPSHPEALQAALVAVNPSTGELKAFVGGYDFNENQYNTATMAHRQPGSSIKPYVYLTALMRGMTVDEIVNDHPVCYPTASGVWCPKNYRGPFTVTQYYGRVNLRTALALSLNSISVQLAVKVGIEDVIRTMRALGITSPLERVLPLAVGSAEISPWEHTYAYATIANGGHEMPRHPGAESVGIFLRKVTDSKGKVLLEIPVTSSSERRSVVPEADAFALQYLMRGVVEQGTGRRVLELQRPAAAKTGTTNDFHDVWFMGFTPDLVTGVWVGRMTPQPIVKEATGAGVALPIWLAFMKAGHPATPAREFPVPADVTLVRGWNGELIPFQRGRLPQQYLEGQSATGNFKLPSPF